ncbi:MAG: ubiquinol-cytochrome c reductase iron-sulfur subunit [Acidimicrobiia bacterium]
MRKTAQRWLLVVGLFTFVSITVLVAVVVSVSSDDSGSDDGLLAVLEVPLLGETESGSLRDGRPVFVVHDLDGTVVVVEAVSAHLPDDSMAWCPSSRTIDDVVHGARWDAQGRYVAGPGRTNLGRYDIEVADGQEELEVRAYIDPPPRSHSSKATTGSSCVDGGYEIHPFYETR